MASKTIWVVKIGSSLLSHQGTTLNEPLITSLVEQFSKVRAAGKDIILISSGSVAIGRQKLGMSVGTAKEGKGSVAKKGSTVKKGSTAAEQSNSAKKTADKLQDIQAAAAVGQTGLMAAYERVLGKAGIVAAQILLTHYDLQRRKSYLNSRATLSRLLALNVLPIINENDTLLDEEVCFGDNDTLAAMTANLMAAELLIILTDTAGLYTANPRHNPDAELVKEIKAEDPRLDTMASKEGGALGKGGMLSKINAARLAMRSATCTIVADGRNNDTLTKILAGDNPGTKFTSERETSVARKRWLAGQLRPLGQIHLDAGAAQALRERGVSLLPIGVLSVAGKFGRGDPVSCYDDKGVEIARGLVNYSNEDCDKIKRQPSNKIATILGYEYEPELIHRDNLALL